MLLWCQSPILLLKYDIAFGNVLYAVDNLQVRFALTSSAVFSQTDIATNSECFYMSVLEYFNDIDEQAKVNDLLVWWNQ